MAEYPLLKKAPANHFSREFITFLSENNPVIYEDVNWLVIENCKYHKKEAPWLTAFYKGPLSESWVEHLRAIDEIFGDWEWMKKDKSKQTIRRPHLHIIKRI